jgi:hypothetical protein
MQKWHVSHGLAAGVLLVIAVQWGWAAGGEIQAIAAQGQLEGGLRRDQIGGALTAAHWSNAAAQVRWTVRFEKAGLYRVSVRLSRATQLEGEGVVTVGDATLPFVAINTLTWGNLVEVPAGTVNVPAGEHSVAVRAKDKRGWYFANVASVRFDPAGAPRGAAWAANLPDMKDVEEARKLGRKTLGSAASATPAAAKPGTAPTAPTPPSPTPAPRPTPAPNPAPEPPSPALELVNGALPAGVVALEPARDGTLLLDAVDAVLDGTGLTRSFSEGVRHIGGWRLLTASAAWPVRLAKPARYRVELRYACDPSWSGGRIELESGAARLAGRIVTTGGKQQFSVAALGLIDLPAGDQIVRLYAIEKPGAELLNLRAIKLTPVP